jgi:hypothetical protein
MNVVSIESGNKEEQRRKEEMLEVLDYLKKQVEAGLIKEFVACSLDLDGLSQVHISTLDVPGAIGMFEIGKHIIISQEAV